MIICCGLAVNRIGMLQVSVRKMKALKVETVTVIGKGRQNPTCLCIKCIKLIVKYFFLDILRGGGCRCGRERCHLSFG